MKKQGELKGSIKNELLRGAGIDSGEYRVRSTTPRGSGAGMRWFRIYAATVLVTVITAFLLIAFLVGEGIPFNGPVSSIVDKIGNALIELDFPMLDTSGGSGHGADDILLLGPDKNEGTESSGSTDTEDGDKQVGTTVGGFYDYDYSLVPDGCIPIIPMDLSLSSYGPGYINNATGYSPDISKLLEGTLGDDSGATLMTNSKAPLVLIVHTHGTEAYSQDGALYQEEGKEIGRSSDTSKNVVAVGKIISDILNQNGIPTAHCTVMHDSVQYKDSYARAEETIKRYLDEFPSIRLVIDLHRDSIVRSSGEIVRPVTEINGEAVAQVMCVVGSDWAGDSHDDWEKNLALALKLRELLNQEKGNLCRPVYLKGNTYNQEIAPYSLLLEVGSSGNSLEEACRSAEIIAEKLCVLIKTL